MLPSRRTSSNRITILILSCRMIVIEELLGCSRQASSTITNIYQYAPDVTDEQIVRKAVRRRDGDFTDVFVCDQFIQQTKMKIPTSGKGRSMVCFIGYVSKRDLHANPQLIRQ